MRVNDRIQKSLHNGNPLDEDIKSLIESEPPTPKESLILDYDLLSTDRRPEGGMGGTISRIHLTAIREYALSRDLPRELLNIYALIMTTADSVFIKYLHKTRDSRSHSNKMSKRKEESKENLKARADIVKERYISQQAGGSG